MRYALLFLIWLSASSAAQFKPGDVVTMQVTAYCPCEKCCGRWATTLSSPKGGRKTSIGDDARICDGVAADPKLLPYRTRLEIPGVGIREVDDTGGAMRQSAKQGNVHIDLRMKSHAEAKQWGVRHLKVKILAVPKTAKSKTNKRSS